MTEFRCHHYVSRDQNLGVMALSKQLLDLHGRSPIKRTISRVLTFKATPPQGAKISLRAIAAFNHDKMAADARYIELSPFNTIASLLLWKSIEEKVFLQLLACIPKGHSQRGRDSNPRYAFGVYTLSRRAPSTTRPPL